MAATGAEIVRQARRYLGAPFRAGGRNAHGLDCAGLIVRVTHDLRLTDFDVPNYHLAFDSGGVGAHLEPFCERIDPGAGLVMETAVGQPFLKPGDFVLFSLARGVQHLGIASGAGTFLHAWDSPSVQAVVETPLDQWWQGRLLAVYRWRGLADG